MSAIVCGRVLPDNKHIWIALTGVYGVGKSRALKVCAHTHINTATKVKDLSDVELESIREALSAYSIEGDLRREVAAARKTLQAIGCYRGIRSRRGLPCRGQRTRTNARTQKRLRRRA